MPRKPSPSHSHGHPWVLPFVLKVLEAGDGVADRVHAGGALLGVWIADDPRPRAASSRSRPTRSPRTTRAGSFRSAMRPSPRCSVGSGSPDLDAALADLRAVVEHVEAAKLAMTGTVPSTVGRARRSRRPSPSSRSGSRRAVDADPAAMNWTMNGSPATRDPRGAGTRPAAPEDPPELGGFEGLMRAVDQLLGPLEAFEAAAERFRTLRR